DFAIRGEPLDRLQTSLEFTNGLLICRQASAERGEQHATADSVTLDLAARKIYLTNAFGTADPQPICRMIGPMIAQVMEPYRFLLPPTARVEGVIPLRDIADADLHFDVSGGPFVCWRFKVPTVSGRVDWVGNRLGFKNVQAQFYGGTAGGGADLLFQ